MTLYPPNGIAINYPRGSAPRVVDKYTPVGVVLHHLTIDRNEMSVCRKILFCIYHYDGFVVAVNIIEISYCLETACFIRKDISIGQCLGRAATSPSYSPV